MNPETEKLIALISKWRATHKGLRFGQWLYNVFYVCLPEGTPAGELSRLLFNIEDESLVDLIQRSVTLNDPII